MRAPNFAEVAALSHEEQRRTVFEDPHRLDSTRAAGAWYVRQTRMA